MYHRRSLLASAEIVSSMVPSTLNRYAYEPTKRMCAVDGGDLEVVDFVRGVQQHCNMNMVC